jgi:hypothetical protein
LQNYYLRKVYDMDFFFLNHVKVHFYFQKVVMRPSNYFSFTSTGYQERHELIFNSTMLKKLQHIHTQRI